MKRYIITIVFGCFVNLLHAQTFIKEPFIYNFLKQEYKAANQNWAIAQDTNGMMFSANSKGLLTFNGSDWQLFQLPNTFIVRSVYADTDGKIYTGAHNEFGYWDRTDCGKLEYHSLNGCLPANFNFQNEDVWRIIKCGQNFYFQTFRCVYVYNGRKIIPVGANVNAPYYPLVVHHGQPYVFRNEREMLRILPEGRFAKYLTLPTGGMIADVIDLDKDRSLVFTTNQGIFELNKGTMKPFRTPADDLLKWATINRVVKTSRGRIVLGTISSGIYVVDASTGNISTHIDKTTGLQNNTVLGLFTDRQGDLWVGLDKGIALVNMGADISIYKSDISIGSVYCSKLYQGNLYLGTNLGLFVSKYNNGPSISFQYVIGSQGQVWSLHNIDGQLICCDNAGLNLVSGNTMKQITGVSGTKDLAWNPHARMLYVACYTGVLLLRKEINKTFTLLKSYNYPAIFKDVECDFDGNLWATGSYGGLWKMKLNARMDSIVSVKKQATNERLFETEYVCADKVGNNILFINGHHIYGYDYVNQRIIPNEMIEKAIKTPEGLYNCVSTGPNDYWMIRSGQLTQFHMSNNGIAKGLQFKYNNYNLSIIDNYENVSAIGNNAYIIGCDDGFVMIRRNMINSQGAGYTPKVDKVVSLNSHGELVTEPWESDACSLPHSRNNIIIRLGSDGLYGYPIKYQYRVNGGEWIDAQENEININNLSTGHYTVDMRMADDNLSKGNVSTYRFYVKAPWYLSIWMWMVYLSLLVGILLLIRYIVHQRMRLQRYIVLKRLRRAHMKELNNLKEELLHKEVQEGKGKIVQYGIFLQKKDEALLQLKDLMEENITSPSQKKKIANIIEKGLSGKEEWAYFQVHFDTANYDFMKKLKDAYPDLTAGDMRFCSYLRLNICTKDIAKLTNISPRSIEIKRYRIRKKLNVPHEQSLESFLEAL